MGWFVAFIFMFFLIYFVSTIMEENKDKEIKTNDLKNSIKLLEHIIEIQKNTPQNPSSTIGRLDINISNDEVSLQEPSHKQEFVLKAVGTLYLHHDEFNFLSTTQTRNIKLSNIIKTDLFTNGLRLYLKNRQRPITFTNLDSPTAFYHLFKLFDEMNRKYSTFQWEDAEYFISELSLVVKELKNKLNKS